jgi:hypothetical protein
MIGLIAMFTSYIGLLDKANVYKNSLRHDRPKTFEMGVVVNCIIVISEFKCQSSI